jgi:glutamine amidotransferase
VPADETDVVITVDYGLPFTAGVQRNNVYGVQFHPEKSQRTGLQILSNFMRIER